MRSIIFIFCYALFLYNQPLSYSAIINLPEDYPTLQEAIEAASSGDVIYINGRVFYLKYNNVTDSSEIKGIRIQNKDITIIGTDNNGVAELFPHNNAWVLLDTETGNQEISPNSNKNLMVIENSNVVFKNLKMSQIQYLHYNGLGTTSAPIQVVSGKMILENVQFTGVLKVFSELEIYNSNIRGYSTYSNSTHTNTESSDYAVPSIHFRNQKSAQLKIENSTIDSSFHFCSRPIVIEDITDSRIQIINTSIKANFHSHNIPKRDSNDSHWNSTDFNKGLAGIFIVNCSNLTFNFNHSKSLGASNPIPGNARKCPKLS